VGDRKGGGGGRDKRGAGGAATLEAQGELPDPSKAAIRLDPDVPRDELLAGVRAVLGPAATFQDIASLVGAPDSADVSFNVGAGVIDVHVSLTNGVMNRQIHNRNGVKTIHNDYFAVYGKGSDYNGYYTWPRFGYDAPINPSTRARLPAVLKGAREISDVFRTAQGRQWWKDHGTGHDMTFDLRKGSGSRKVLSSYIRERRARGDLAASTGLGAFTRQVRNAAALGFRSIGTFAAGKGRSAP
jgi:hypothetical protein